MKRAKIQGHETKKFATPEIENSFSHGATRAFLALEILRRSSFVAAIHEVFSNISWSAVSMSDFKRLRNLAETAPVMKR